MTVFPCGQQKDFFLAVDPFCIASRPFRPDAEHLSQLFFPRAMGGSVSWTRSDTPGNPSLHPNAIEELLARELPLSNFSHPFVFQPLWSTMITTQVYLFIRWVMLESRLMISGHRGLLRSSLFSVVESNFHFSAGQNG